MRIILFIFVVCARLWGQGQYLEQGESALSIGFGLGTNKHASSFVFGLGYSIETELDLGIGFGNIDFKDNFIHDKLNANTFDAWASYHLINHKTVNLSANVGYSSLTYGGDDLDNLDIDVGAEFWSYGGNLFWALDKRKDWRVLPSIGIFYETVSFDIKNQSEDVIVELDEEGVFFYIARLAIVLPTSSHDFITLVPSVSFTEDITSYRISASLNLGVR